MQLKNYPSGDPEFDKWFRETQPAWAAQIDAEIAKEQRYQELVQAGEELEGLLVEGLTDTQNENWSAEVDRFLSALSESKKDKQS